MPGPFPRHAAFTNSRHVLISSAVPDSSFLIRRPCSGGYGRVELRKRSCNLCVAEFVMLQLPAQVRFVRAQVEVAVTA